MDATTTPNPFKLLKKVARTSPGAAPQLDALAAAQALIGPDMQAVRDELERLLVETPLQAGAAARQLVDAGGKRLRPMLTLLCARAATADDDREDRDSAVICAAAAELVHSATLLHDDVIDDGQVRRGVPAARVLFGNTMSVLSGDLLLVTAMREVEREAPRAVSRELIETVGALVRGEVHQLTFRGSQELTLASYEQIIADKTAALFRWCARAGALCAGAAPERARALGRYGQQVGLAFQLRDDLLDLLGDPARTGKALAADLGEGKLTYPLIVALQRDPALGALLQRCAERWPAPPAPSDLAAVTRRAKAAGGLRAARQRMEQARTAATAALQRLPRSSARQVLTDLAGALIVRQR